MTKSIQPRIRSHGSWFLFFAFQNIFTCPQVRYDDDKQWHNIFMWPQQSTYFHYYSVNNPCMGTKLLHGMDTLHDGNCERVFAIYYW